VIGTERLEMILQTIAVSGLVKEGRGPISAQLIAPPDAGKSQLLFANLPQGARVVDDFTFSSLVSILDADKPPAWLVVPDFNTAISHKPQVATLTMSVLLGLLAEGISEIPGFDGHPRLKAKIKRLQTRATTVALLTGLTPDMFFSQRGKWRETGLLRRLVPIYYTYSAATQHKISTSIRLGGDALDYSRHNMKHAKRHTVSIDIGIASDLERLANDMAKYQLVWTYRNRKISAFEFSFSLHKTLRQYVKAHALLNGRAIVRRKDFDATLDFSKFVRYDRPEEI
jgi:hypothetical protein